jgi:hypothetical protein
MACGYYNILDGSESVIATSDDGDTWTKITNIPFIEFTFLDKGCNCIAYGAGKFVVIGKTSVSPTNIEIYYSTNGITWAKALVIQYAVGLGLNNPFNQFNQINQFNQNNEIELPAVSFSDSAKIIWTGSAFIIAQNGSPNILYSYHGINWTTPNIVQNPDYTNIYIKSLTNNSSISNI